MAKDYDISSILGEYSTAGETLDQLKDSGTFRWTDREALLSNVLVSKDENKYKSKIQTGELVNNVLDSASRTTAQLPTGNVEEVDSDDGAEAYLLTKILDKYVIPNAKSQWDFFVKAKVWSIYADVYGAMPAMVMWKVSLDGGYTGPDMELVSPRNIRFQPGKVSVSDMDYVFVDTYVTKTYLNNLLKQSQLRAKEAKEAKAEYKSTWKTENIQKLLEDLENGANEDRSTEGSYNEQQAGQKATHQLKLTTKYSSDGTWIVFHENSKQILRVTQKPEIGIPIVVKNTYPLLDRIYGLGKFERGESPQKALDSLINMYFDGVKMSMFPPLLVNTRAAQASSIVNRPNAKWLVREPGAVQPLNVNPTGMSTFQNSYGVLKGLLQNQSASTDTSVAVQYDPGYGKTPQALKMQQAREGARDNWERYMMEIALEEVFNLFIKFIICEQVLDLTVKLGKGEVSKMMTLFGEEALDGLEITEDGTVTIHPDMWKGKQFRYVIDHGSTVKKDEQIQNQTLGGLIQMSSTNPMIQQGLAEEGKKIDMASLIQKFIQTSGVDDGEKLIKDIEMQAPPMGMPMEEPMSPELPEQMPPMEEQMMPPLPDNQMI